MKLVKESLDKFVRAQNPKKSLDIGEYRKLYNPKYINHPEVVGETEETINIVDWNNIAPGIYKIVTIWQNAPSSNEMAYIKILDNDDLDIEYLTRWGIFGDETELLNDENDPNKSYKYFHMAGDIDRLKRGYDKFVYIEKVDEIEEYLNP